MPILNFHCLLEYILRINLHMCRFNQMQIDLNSTDQQMLLELNPSSTVISYSHILYFCCSLYNIDNVKSQNILHVNISLHFSYPDVMMPSYNRSRWFVIYFVVYISVTLYFLMNLVRRNSIRSHFLWQHIEVFCLFHLTVQSPKLKVACNAILFSTPRALFMQNTM